jgi:hypothetical protein
MSRIKRFSNFNLNEAEDKSDVQDYLNHPKTKEIAQDFGKFRSAQGRDKKSADESWEDYKKQAKTDKRFLEDPMMTKIAVSFCDFKTVAMSSAEVWSNFKRHFPKTLNEAAPTKFDITKSSKSLAGKLESFIGKMGKLDVNAIKAEFMKILTDPDTYASEQTRSKWKAVVANAKSKIAIMQAITNLYLKAANLGLHESDDKDL